MGLRRTVEVELEFETPLNWPRNAATPPLVRRRLVRTSTGKPTTFAAEAISDIRDGEFGRQENRNRSSSCSSSCSSSFRWLDIAI